MCFDTKYYCLEYTPACHSVSVSVCMFAFACTCKTEWVNERGHVCVCEREFVFGDTTVKTSQIVDPPNKWKILLINGNKILSLEYYFTDFRFFLLKRNSQQTETAWQWKFHFTPQNTPNKREILTTHWFVDRKISTHFTFSVCC